MHSQNTLHKLLTTSTNFFITGKAGTGKSTLARLLIERLKEEKKKFVVLAPTGIAAINIGGVTIHSFFSFGTKIIKQEAVKIAEGFLYNPVDDSKKKLFNALDYIIIDEVSMLRADLLDAVDIFLKTIRQNNRPFGGIKIIFFGDLYQLPPVVLTKEIYIKKKYDKSYFYNSDAFYQDEFKLELIELTKVHRQKDSKFVEVLNRFRIGKIFSDDIVYINQAKYHNFTKEHIIITTINSIKDEINRKKLKELDGKIYSYKMIINGNITAEDKKNSIFSENLILKKGARVMFLVNDNFTNLYVNGTLGFVEELDEDEVKVKIDNGPLVTLKIGDTRQNFEEYVYNQETKKIEKKKRGSISQIPLTLAWAITIHKSQGMTYDKVSLDFGRGCWLPGQAYVALSRVKTYEGLHLQKTIPATDVFADEGIKKFLDESINSKNILDIKKGIDITKEEQEIFFSEKGGINYFNVAKLVIKKIQNAGGDAYIVGGFCRNRLKNLASPTDIDISTNLLPNKIKKIFRVVNTLGEKFGMLIIKEHSFIYEITTFREDKDRKNVLFTNRFKEDANRRDFTINAIYLDPLKDEYVIWNNEIKREEKIPANGVGFYISKYRQNGLYDLKNNIIRFIGKSEDRIKEDPIRLLRYVRFKNSLNLKDIEQAEIIVKQNFYLLKNVAFERIKVELEKIFAGNNVVKAVDELKKFGFFELFIPEIDKLNTCPGGPKYHLEGNVWQHILLILDYLEKQNIKDPIYYWIALFHDTGKMTTYSFDENHNIHYFGHEKISTQIFEKYINKLKFTSKQAKIIKYVIEKHGKYGIFPQMKKLKQIKYFLHNYWEYFYIFGDADNNGRKLSNKEIGKEINNLYLNFKEKYEQIKNKLYSGNDIIKKYPNLEGKEIGERLEQLNNEIILKALKK